MKPDPGKRKRLAIVSLSPIAQDGRVLRQADYARREYRVDVIGLGEWVPPWPEVSYHRVELHKTRSMKTRRTALFLAGQLVPSLSDRGYWILPANRRILRLLQRAEYDLIHANEPPALLACVAAAQSTGAKVVYDAHEYSLDRDRPRTLLGPLVLRDLRRLLQRHLPRADACVTVSEGLANLYRKALGVDMRIVMNAPDKVEIQQRNVDPQDVRLFHHGLATPARYQEGLIRMIGLLGRHFSLHLMPLNPKSDYVIKLKDLAERIAPDRVHFREPVQPADIVTTIAQYDMGVYILPPLVLNHMYALPNKFFDFVAGGLAIGIGPSPEMARLTRRFDMGVVAQDFEPESLAKELNALQPEDINRLKRNALTASETLNAATEMGKLMAIYSEVLSKAGQ